MARDELTTAVFVDLDSTLCDTRPRKHLINHKYRQATDWTAYSMGCADDEPMESVIALVRLLAEHHRIVLLSGRSELAEELTREWLRVYHVPYDDLILRKEGDERSNGRYKADSIKLWKQANACRPVLLLDDWPPVKKAVEATGVPVVVVNPLYDESAEREVEDGDKLASGRTLA